MVARCVHFFWSEMFNKNRDTLKGKIIRVSNNFIVNKRTAKHYSNCLNLNLAEISKFVKIP